MLPSRSRPHDGTQLTLFCTASTGCLRAASARPRLPFLVPTSGNVPVSSAMNHCDVARKMTGLWHRQQCGYGCPKDSRCQSRPRSWSAWGMFGLASNTRRPPNSSTVSRK